MLVTSPLGFDAGIKAISGNRERLPPQSIPHLSPICFYSDLRMITNKFLKNWKKINANAIAINAISRET